MSARYRVAVLGADTAVGEVLLDLLIDRRFPSAEILALALAPTQGAVVQAGGEEWDLSPADSCDYHAVQLVFLAYGADLDAALLARISAAGCCLIDAAGALRNAPEVPLLVPEINSELLSDYGRDRRLSAPGALSIALALALAPLHRAAGLKSVQLSSYQAVSALGREAVEELAQQTRQLLTFQPVSHRVFGQQIAFNCLPVIGRLDAEGHSQEELDLVRETRQLLNAPTLAIGVTAVQVPVFYGHAAAVHIQTERPLELDAARRLLESAPGLCLSEGVEYPTQIGQASGEDAVFIGRLRRDLPPANGLSFWLVTDNLRKGAALNAVQIAEALVERNLL
jgi:aspartate-semialdehyde dehydrogenase